jgi:hypothetical protein
MKARKRRVTQEPLLNAVARKLGHAAGRLTQVTQELTENLAAIPKNLTAKVRESAKDGEPAERSRAHILHPTKKISRTPRTQRMKVAAGIGRKGKLSKNKSPRRRPAA